MNKVLLYAAIAIPICAQVSFAAKTKDQLISEFAELFGDGVYARIVWQVEGMNNRKPNFDLWGGNSTLMALDTRDGEVRELVPAQGGTHWSSATLTWDGLRVVYTDNEGKSCWIIDFDGNNKRKLLDNYDGDGRTWRSDDGKDWMLATQWNANTNADVKLQKVNVDDVSEKIDLLDITFQRPDWAGSTCWASSSVDGNFVGGGFPNYGALGWLNTSSGSIQYFTEENGCWPSIAHDNSYDMMHITTGDLAHREIRVVGKNGQEVLRKDLSNNVLSGNLWLESLRWAHDRNYCSIWAYGDGFNAEGIPNPRIIRISDLQYVAINDNPSYPEGNADVFVYTSISNKHNAPAYSPSIIRTGLSGAYDCRGRTLDMAFRMDAGIRLQTDKSGKLIRNLSLD